MILCQCYSYGFSSSRKLTSRELVGMPSHSHHRLRFLLKQEANFEGDLVLNFAVICKPTALLRDFKPLHIAQCLPCAFYSPLYCILEANERGSHQFCFPVDFAFLICHCCFLLKTTMRVNGSRELQIIFYHTWPASSSKVSVYMLPQSGTCLPLPRIIRIHNNSCNNQHNTQSSHREDKRKRFATAAVISSVRYWRRRGRGSRR